MPNPQNPPADLQSFIRARLRQPGYANGVAFPIVDLARELGLSQTPVREALAHLAGEGLIEERRGQGYFAPTLDRDRLLELYDLQRLYVTTAIETLPTLAPRKTVNSLARRLAFLAREPSLEDRGAPVDVLCSDIVALPGNGALILAHQRITAQIAPARRVEVEAFGNPHALLKSLAQQVDRRDMVGASEAAAGLMAWSVERLADVVRRLRIAA